MKTLQARIFIGTEEGAPIAYLYSVEAFDSLGIKKQQWDNAQFLEIGHEFLFEGRKLKVKNINLKMNEALSEVTSVPDFNSQIGIFVEVVE